MSQKFKNVCKMCGAELNTMNTFCSDKCQEDSFIYMEIEIPRIWVRNSLQRVSKEEREINIVKYSKKHGYSLRLLRKKLMEKFGIGAAKEKNELSF